MDRQVKWFLVEYDRHERSLRKLTEYAEPEQRQKAWNRLIELEDEQFPELQNFAKTGTPLRMEYVLLLAESEEAIRVSHGNYFGDGYLTLAEFQEIAEGKRAKPTPLAVAG